MPIRNGSMVKGGSDMNETTIEQRRDDADSLSTASKYESMNQSIGFRIFAYKEVDPSNRSD